MAWPIVTVPVGGLPVTEAANGLGTPVEEAANGFGTAVTFVDRGGIPIIGGGALRGDAWIDFTRMADGVPGDFATGQKLVLGYDGAGPATVSNGALIVTTESATYNAIELSEDIESIYADVSYSDGDDIAALIASAGASQAGVGASSLHVVFGAGSWAVQYLSQDESDVVHITTEASGTFDAMPFGQKGRAGWRRDGNDIYLRIPTSRYGSEIGPVTSAAAATRTNHCLTFEHYRNGGGVPGTKFYAVAANIFGSPEAAGRTNLFVSAGDFSNVAWIKNALGAPTPAAIGQQMLETAATDYHWCYQNIPSIAATPTRCSLRFDAKLVGRDWAKLTCYDGALSGRAQRFLNLTTGALGDISGSFRNQFFSIYPLGNGLHRVQAEFLTNPAAAGLYAAIGLSTSGSEPGDGYAGDTAKGLIVVNPCLFTRPF
jgi:hypothetical protein